MVSAQSEAPISSGLHLWFCCPRGPALPRLGFVLLGYHGQRDLAPVDVEILHADLDLVPDGNDVTDRVGPAGLEGRDVNKTIELPLDASAS